MLRQIELQAICMALIANGFAITVIRSPHRSASKHGFVVDATSSTCAIVDEEARETGEQIVPEVVKSHDVLHLSHTFTPFCIVV